MEQPVECTPSTNSRVLDGHGTSHEGTLEAVSGLDAEGTPFHATHLFLGTSEYLSRPNMSIVLFLNGQRQATTVWNGRLVGLGQPVQISETDVNQNFCVNVENFWNIPLGFGTIAEEPHGSTDPGFSVVGHPLREGQELEVRVDVCTGSSCIPGTSRTMRVHFIPS